MFRPPFCELLAASNPSFLYSLSSLCFLPGACHRVLVFPVYMDMYAEIHLLVLVTFFPHWVLFGPHLSIDIPSEKEVFTYAVLSPSTRCFNPWMKSSGYLGRRFYDFLLPSYDFSPCLFFRLLKFFLSPLTTLVPLEELRIHIMQLEVFFRVDFFPFVPSYSLFSSSLISFGFILRSHLTASFSFSFPWDL